MTNTVTFENAMYRNRAVEGTFELVQDFTRWGGAATGKRRQGNTGDGYLKVMQDGRIVKITVANERMGYTVNTAEADALAAEIAELEALVASTTGAERSKFRKRLVRRVAKRDAA